MLHRHIRDEAGRREAQRAEVRARARDGADRRIRREAALAQVELPKRGQRGRQAGQAVLADADLQVEVQFDRLESPPTQAAEGAVAQLAAAVGLGLAAGRLALAAALQQTLADDNAVPP